MPEQVCQCGGGVVHHGAFPDFVVFPDVRPCDDEWYFHCRHGFAAVVFGLSAMVCGEDDVCRFGDGALFDCGSYVADVAVDRHGLFHVFWGEPSVFMPGCVRFMKGDEGEGWLFFADEADGFLGNGGVAALFAEGFASFVEEAVHDFPVVEVACGCIGCGRADEAEDAREAPVAAGFPGRKVGLLAAPCGVAVQFGRCSHEHGCPVGRTGGGEDGAVFQGE